MAFSDWQTILGANQVDIRDSPRFSHTGAWGESYLIGGGEGECSNIDVMRAIFEAIDQPADAFAWANDRPDNDHRYAIGTSKLRIELG